MTPELLNLFGQLPLVGIFAAFVIWMRNSETREREKREDRDAEERAARDKQWQDFIKEQNNALTSVLNKLCSSFEEHDEKVAANFEILKERTASIAKTRRTS